VGKQTRLHVVQRVEPSAALAQVHPFVPFAPFLQPPVYKVPDVVQVTFCKIRTHGYLANRNRHQRFNEVLKKLKLPLHKGLIKIPMQIRMLEQFGIDINECPCCKNNTLKLVKVFYPWKQAGDG
jgi:hypothetical protein